MGAKPGWKGASLELAESPATLGFIALLASRRLRKSQTITEKLQGCLTTRHGSIQTESLRENGCDAVILSIGYGLDEEQMRKPPHDRRMSANLGPINRVGGERRLKVANARAREGLTVISSFLAEITSDSETRGVQGLKDYLRSRNGTGRSLSGALRPPFE